MLRSSYKQVHLCTVEGMEGGACLGELGAAVGQHEHLVVDAGALAPGVHHKGIIDRDAGDGVDALRLELVRLLHEAGQVLGAARRREGAGHREQHDLRGSGGQNWSLADLTDAPAAVCLTEELA